MKQHYMKQRLPMHQCGQATSKAADALSIDANIVSSAIVTGHDAWP